MRQILDEASSRYDWIILDAPPVGVTTDARLLAEFVGGTLLVVRAGVTRHDDVTNSISVLGREHILGVVLNGVTPDPRVGQYYGISPTDVKP